MYAVHVKKNGQWKPTGKPYRTWGFALKMSLRFKARAPQAQFMVRVVE